MLEDGFVRAYGSVFLTVGMRLQVNGESFTVQRRDPMSGFILVVNAVGDWYQLAIGWMRDNDYA